MTTAGIYIIRNKWSKKVYVGSSTRIEIRLVQHRSYLSCGSSENSHLQRAWDKYGREAFTFELLEALSWHSRETIKQFNRRLAKREQYWIDFYGSLNPDKGYNQRGPERLDELSDEARVKHYAIMRSPEYRANLRAACNAPDARARYLANQGAACRTPEFRAKLRAANLGRKHTSETRAKISVACLGKKRSPEARANI